MSDLVRYDAMCTAIAECHRVDEVKDMRDKARALELYAQQAKNTDAERRACEIRLRAERRTGELLRDLARATPAEAGKVSGEVRAPNVSHAETRSPPSPYADTLARTGISRQTAHRYQALADVPAATFEAAMREPVKPTTSGVIAQAKAAAVVQQARDPQPRMPDDVLWLWGRMRDFERECFTSKDPQSLLQAMTESMRADVARISPLMVDFFRALEDVAHESA